MKTSDLFTHTLVTFDISDNKNRTKLGEALKDLGMFRIQESVFYGRLNKAERTEANDLLRTYCSSDDKGILIPNINHEIVSKFLVGYDSEIFEFKQVEIE